MKMTGNVTATTARDLTAAALTQAREFFGTDCVQVRVGEATANLAGSYSAQFQGQEHHRVEARTYGPPRCRTCGKDSWRSNPLPQAVWS